MIPYYNIKQKEEIPKMKVLLVNGCVEQTTLKDTVFQVLEDRDIDVVCSDLEHETAGCITCGKCIKKRKCVLDDEVNVNAQYSDLDGIIVICHMQYHRVDQNVIQWVKRLMYSSCERWNCKPYAVIYVSRQFGDKEQGELDALFSRGNMIKVQDQNGCVVHSKEDLQRVKNIVDRLGWLVSCLEKGKEEITGTTDAMVLKDFVR